MDLAGFDLWPANLDGLAAGVGSQEHGLLGLARMLCTLTLLVMLRL